MTENIRKYLFLPVFISLFLTGCFSPWKGDEATLTLLLGDSRGGRAMAPAGTVHTVELEGPTGKQTIKDVKEELSVKVAPGYWRVSIKAFLVNGKLFAEGNDGLLVKAGQNNQITIEMHRATTDITINFPKDGKPELELPEKYKNQNIIISSVYNDIQTFFGELFDDSFTVKIKNTNREFIEIEWLIWNTLLIDNSENNDEITIRADEHNAGTYELTVKVKRVIDGIKVPYSTTVKFEVRDWIGIKDLNDLKKIGNDQGTMRQKYRLLNEKEIRLPNDWTAIIDPFLTPFNGEFDGDNKKINLGDLGNDNRTTATSNSTSVISLFAIIGTEGIVKNLELEGSIQASGSNTYVGAVAGIHYGIIQDVTAKVSISLGNGAQTDGYADHADFPKGIVGQNGQGIVKRCTNTGSVQ